MLQTQEQDKVPEELSELEISNLPHKVFKVIIINVLKELERRKMNTTRILTKS